MKISHYQFGRMVIENRTYTGDLIIHGQNVSPNWWRKEGHRLDLDDLSGVKLEKVTDLIVGTGYYGVMTVSPSVVEYCRQHKINLQALPTPQAVDLFNGWSGDRNLLVGAFHLTC
ncbi:MAG TPA: MTH938/NDUFAF3 family protein [archaeon]|nr:MTH938/NDUFAF3 family protein [archaeon]